MPVVTRSCGRKEVRSRIEDPTPRRPRSTVKRKKDVSDEETEKPARKKPNNIVRETAATPSTSKQTPKSKIPRRIATKNSQKKHLDSDEEDVVCYSSPHETSTYATPVAARTRSYSSLKRSYQGKRYQKNAEKNNNESLDSSFSQNKNNMSDNVDNNKTPEPQETQQVKPSQVGDIDSSTCDNESNDVEMKDAQENIGPDGMNNEVFYKKKFHELLEHVRSMQENFNNAQTNASKNIKAYDTFMKELKENLEKERAKTVTIEEELQNTNNQLVKAQKELEQTNVQPKDTSSVEASNGDIEKVDNYSSLQSMIKFYEMLSGISLSCIGDCMDSFESYRCVYKPKDCEGKAMQFDLTYDKEVEEVQFSPIVQSPTSGEFLEKMPKYLRENIYFGTDQVPCFLSKLIQTYQKLQ